MDKELQAMFHSVANISWDAPDTRIVNCLYVQEKKGDSGDKEMEENIFTVDKFLGFFKKFAILY